jgi:hypothetical protein
MSEQPTGTLHLRNNEKELTIRGYKPKKNNAKHAPE